MASSSQFQQLLDDVWPLVPTYAHLLLSAIFPIYAGAHASLSRPSSAAEPAKSSDDDDTDDAQDDEDGDGGQRMEGLSPTDALMFPLMAGCTLAGLYFLIKWLQDPALLNKILNAYFAIFGALSVAKLLADVLAFVQGMVFPGIWVNSKGVAWQVKSKERIVVPLVKDEASKNIASRTSPLPGWLSHIKLSKEVEKSLWLARELPRHKWTIQLYVQQLVSTKAHIGINGLISIILAVIAVIYFNLVDKPWWLTNLMGFGFSYGALQLLSPTTFSTGALILSALFFYDIYFVFYTPMMVTVAKSLDIPIKLVFPRPAAPGETPEQAKRTHAMLGLGDVVLPGIMIGLALRFDLFMHYVRKQRKTNKKLESTANDTEKNDTTGQQSPEEIIKAPYASLSGKYGEAFWTHSWLGQPLLPRAKSSEVTTSAGGQLATKETSFPKPYFHASVTGYLLGLLVTLSVMHIWGHAQPALLYLVPGVLLSLLLTGAIRGELTAMWEYTELEEETVDTAAKDSTKSANNDEKAAAGDKTNGGKEQSTVEVVKVGQHEEKALIKFSVSKKDFGSKKSIDTRTSVSNDNKSEDQGNSTGLEVIASGGEVSERPAKRSRMI